MAARRKEIMTVLAVSLLLAVAMTAVGCAVEYHLVSVGLFRTPPEPGLSVFVRAHGFPLPVYAVNPSPEFAPVRSMLFWKGLVANFSGAYFVSVAMVTGAVIIGRLLSPHRSLSRS